jgi:hypothetical protein
MSTGEHPAASIECLARVGLEVELLGPAGVTRDVVASGIAARVGGSVRRVFEHCTEPPTGRSSRRVWHHLSRGVEVVDAGGGLVCRIVDDVTITTGLRTKPSPVGDYRIVGDDKRIVRLIGRLASPTASIDDVLAPAAAVFGGSIEPKPDGRRVRLADADGTFLATAMLQTADRERVCEIVTPVIAADHRAALERLLEPARTAGCVVPVEAAVHVHFDGDVFRHAGRFARLVELFTTRRDELRRAFDTNPRCRLLGPLPDELVAYVRSQGFDQLPWAEVDAAIRTMPLSKYCDVNLRNLRDRPRGKDTVEVRILAGSIDAGAIADQVEYLQQLLTDLD